MAAHFQSSNQEELFNATVAELQQLGYNNDRLQLDYGFRDYFQDELPERTVPAAAFGQTPVDYKTACFGVLLTGEHGYYGRALVESCRALGAPLHFEVHQDRVAL